MRVQLVLAIVLPASLGFAQETPPTGEPTTTPPVTEPTTTVETPSTADDVPGKGIGIGAGWRFPGGDIQVPNTASVRFRFGSGVTLEALLHAGFELNTTGPEGAKTTERDLEVSGSGLARIPLARRGRFEFPLLLGAGLSITNSKTDPNGANNDTTATAFGVTAVWGIGIDWFFKSNFSFSLSATNPAVSFTFTKTDGPITDTSTTNFQVAAIFEPVITAMFHLYF